MKMCENTHSPQVMAVEAGSCAIGTTLSVTSSTIMLPSERQAATRNASTGLHFRSWTKVSDSEPTLKDAKGRLSCLVCRKEINKKLECVRGLERRNVLVLCIFFLKSLPCWRRCEHHRSLAWERFPHKRHTLTGWAHRCWGRGGASGGRGSVPGTSHPPL